MLGYEDLQRGLDLITDNSARTLNLGEGYGIEAGRPANLLILSAPSDYEMIRSQGHALASIRTGKLLMQRTPARVERCCLAPASAAPPSATPLRVATCQICVRTAVYRRSASPDSPGVLSAAPLE